MRNIIQFCLEGMSFKYILIKTLIGITCLSVCGSISAGNFDELRKKSNLELITELNYLKKLRPSQEKLITEKFIKNIRLELAMGSVCEGSSYKSWKNKMDIFVELMRDFAIETKTKALIIPTINTDEVFFNRTVSKTDCKKHNGEKLEALFYEIRLIATIEGYKATLSDRLILGD